MWKIKCLPSHLQMQTYLSGFFVYFQIFVRNAFMFFGLNMSQVDLTSFSGKMFLFKIKSVTDTVDVNNFTTNNLISYYLFHIMKEQINFGIHYLWNTQNLWYFQSLIVSHPQRGKWSMWLLLAGCSDVKSKSKTEILLYSLGKSIFSVKSLVDITDNHCLVFHFLICHLLFIVNWALGTFKKTTHFKDDIRISF